MKCASLSRYVWALIGELPFLFRVLLPWPDSQSVVGCERDSRHTKVEGGGQNCSRERLVMKSAARVEIQAALCPAVQSNVLIEKDKSFFSSLLD